MKIMQPYLLHLLLGHSPPPPVQTQTSYLDGPLSFSEQTENKSKVQRVGDRGSSLIYAHSKLADVIEIARFKLPPSHFQGSGRRGRGLPGLAVRF